MKVFGRLDQQIKIPFAVTFIRRDKTAASHLIYKTHVDNIFCYYCIDGTLQLGNERMFLVSMVSTLDKLV